MKKYIHFILNLIFSLLVNLQLISAQESESSMSISHPIDMNSWKSIQCVQGRLATTEDISQGSAVFVLDPKDKNMIIRPVELPLPVCAIIKEDNNEIPVIIIQAEEIVNDQKIFGVIDVFSGTHMVCSSKDDIKILDKPNKLFFSKQGLAN